MNTRDPSPKPPMVRVDNAWDQWMREVHDAGEDRIMKHENEPEQDVPVNPKHKRQTA